MSIARVFARDEEDEIALRLINCIPGATFELEQVLTFVDIELTDSIPTAAVTTGLRSSLLLNPDFVEEHCQSDEHLFLLVMHELWHVLLGHTSLFSRVSFVENLAFDAVINAALTRQFPGPEFRGFFEELNPSDSFPGRLLRAPEGWPNRTDYSGPGPKGTNSILMRLYPLWRQQVAEPTYNELIELLRSDPEVRAAEERWSRGEGRLDGDGAPVLVGDHTEEGAKKGSEVLRSALGRLAIGWPDPPYPVISRGVGGSKTSWAVEAIEPPPTNRSVLEKVLLRTAQRARNGHRQISTGLAPSPATVVVPSACDRQRVARRRLGLPTLLWNGQVPRPARSVEAPRSAKVYLDVSGSMADVLPELLPALTAFVRQRLATAWQFSEEVWPLSLQELVDGDLTTTYGTVVTCALEHALADDTTRHIVIITDGGIERVEQSIVEQLRDRNIGVDVVLSRYGMEQEVERFANVTRLPC